MQSQTCHHHKDKMSQSVRKHNSVANVRNRQILSPSGLWESPLMRIILSRLHVLLTVIERNRLFHILVDKMVNFAVMTAGCCVVVLRFFRPRPCTEIANRQTASSPQQIMLALGLTILQLFALVDQTNWQTATVTGLLCSSCGQPCAGNFRSVYSGRPIVSQWLTHSSPAPPHISDGVCYKEA